MNNYLLALGWWNFAGSVLMTGLFNETFGKKLMNEWTKIFKEEFRLDYWSKLWMGWAIGLNIFFGLINILSVKWDHEELKLFVIAYDIIAYILFTGLTLWGISKKRLNSGGYMALAIFAFWIIWGILALTTM